MSEMSESSRWKEALTNIIEKLRKEQYQKMLVYLENIPESVKDDTDKEHMAQTIIENYGEEESIAEIKRIMDEIPRKDYPIQNLLRPFVEKLGKKRKPGPESEEQQESPSELKKKKTKSSDDEDEDEDDVKTGFEKNNAESDSDDETQADDPGSLQSEKKVPLWRQSIELLKESGDTDGKPVCGKVIQKCLLRTYKTKEKQKKFFHLAIADETDCIKVMVYKEELFNKIEEGHPYLFTDVEVHVVHGEMVMKVTKHSKISKTHVIKVPKTLELQSPFFSIKNIKSLKEKTAVSVEGTVIEIEFQEDGTKVNTREFKLEDKTGSIWIKLWHKDIEQLRGMSIGDLVRVTNLMTNHYNEAVSLNSTDFIRIHKMKAAAVQNVTMEIVGIIEAGKEQSELYVRINNKSRSFFINSPLLAKVFDVKLDNDFEDELLKKIPFSAKGKIKGNKIQTLKAAEAKET